ncbi:hypothetical protein VT84_13835 [Gemmata sp. SH-PL17]|uniref:hypothetical protein n=1 Tax=Gemmata sp. SH-PL17 TaxID=1630693 RepID=UPI00078D1E72|nr:hypothetical protein [Gemmata sp. SH-PL17]AMV25474.1 hypothetical protein VT84_13835 [Gemmata sp. SH-PL17]
MKRRKRNRALVKTQVIHALRAAQSPLSTRDLAALCASDRSQPSWVTLAVLVKLEQSRVVVRHPPTPQGEGRPAWRWSLRVGSPGVCKAA